MRNIAALLHCLYNNYRIFALWALAIMDSKPGTFKVNNKLLVHHIRLLSSNVSCTSFVPFFVVVSLEQHLNDFRIRK